MNSRKIIENKIKSSQHSNQLDKYKYITAKDKETALAYYEKWKGVKFPKDFSNFVTLETLSLTVQKFRKAQKKNVF